MSGTVKLQVGPILVGPTNPVPTYPAPMPATIARQAAAFTEATKTVAAVGTPERLVAVSTLVDSVVISPLRTNTAAVFWGTNSANDTQAHDLPVALQAPPGEKIDLYGIYIDVTVAGEGVRYTTID